MVQDKLHVFCCPFFRTLRLNIELEKQWFVQVFPSTYNNVFFNRMSQISVPLVRWFFLYKRAWSSVKRWLDILIKHFQNLIKMGGNLRNLCRLNYQSGKERDSQLKIVTIISPFVIGCRHHLGHCVLILEPLWTVVLNLEVTVPFNFSIPVYSRYNCVQLDT